MRLMRFGKLLLLSGLVAVMALTLAACSSDEEKPVLVFSDLDWNSAQIQNGIARKIAEVGYGYETDAIFGGTVPLMQALTSGETNITMEIWLPNQQAAYDTAEAEGTIVWIGNSLEDNWQSMFVIPQYFADANPGLQSVEDLKKEEYWSQLVTPASKGKARLITCIPGWECENVNIKKIDAYGLNDTVELINPGSGAALDAEITAALEKRDPVLFYYWGPTTLTHKIESEFGGYKILEEPPYSEECWAADGGCAYPTAEVGIVVRTELQDSAPDIVNFLAKWDFSAGNQLAAEGYMNESGADFPAVATWFLQNTTEWKSWVTDDAVENIESGL
jgi:glycine betaine/proline transport system substrate-binding protein